MGRRQSILDANQDPSSPHVLTEDLLNEGLDPISIRGQLTNVFLAGRGAVSNNIANIMFLLARKPGCWTKLRTEVLRADVFSPAEFDQLSARPNSLPYLQRIVNESLRMLPTLGFTERVAQKDTWLPVGGGIDGSQPISVRNGDVFVLHFPSLHRRKDIWGDDADDFNPDRWLSSRPPPWTFIPFGGGPRICIGQKLALFQIYYILAVIAATFESIESRDPEQDYAEDYKLTTGSLNGIKVSLRYPENHERAKG